jgi:hypothetical protein
MSGFEQGRDMIGKIATSMVCGWFLLESAKDWLLGVYPLGQHVSSYGTSCWIIRCTSDMSS